VIFIDSFIAHIHGKLIEIICTLMLELIFFFHLFTRSLHFFGFQKAISSIHITSYLFNVLLSSHYYFLFCSKLKELSKRTTFIRVTQQINEVFGSTNEEKEEVSMPIELMGNGAQVSDAHVDGGDSKRVKGN
jgi:hypothetical protein